MPLQRLEPCGSKDPCTVLRGLDAGNRAQLPDKSVAYADLPAYRSSIAALIRLSRSRFGTYGALVIGASRSDAIRE
jgi:hypothetical protein